MALTIAAIVLSGCNYPFGQDQKYNPISSIVQHIIKEKKNGTSRRIGDTGSTDSQEYKSRLPR